LPSLWRVCCCVALSLGFGGIARLDAHTVDIAAFLGTAGTTFAPYDSPDASADLDHIRRNTFGARVRVGLKPGLSLVGDVSRVPRGGYASFRQSYGYFAEYLQPSARLELSRQARAAALYLNLGPTVGVRSRWENSYTLNGPPTPPAPEFGKMEKVEVGVLLSAGIRSTGKVQAFAEMQVGHGITRLHDRGAPGSFQDPHVLDFRARSRGVAGIVGLGIALKR
jgi:hypothetical protein